MMLEDGAKNSRAARYINGLTASIEFNDYSFIDYFQDLKETELKNYVIKNTSDVINKKTIKINLKEHTLNIEGDEVCAPNFQVNMSIKESFRLLNRRQTYVKNLYVKKLCFKNSRVTKIVLPKKVLKDKYTIRLPFTQLIFKSKLNDEPTMHFHGNGKLSHFSGIKFSKLIEMFYRCDGEISYTRSEGCRGPFNNHETTIKDPIGIKFDINERIRTHFNR